jgi:NCS1 family nucleobase:cation symporter-1
MCADYWVIRRQRIKLTNLYHPEGSVYWYTHGVNWRIIPAWICGWAPTIGGLIVSVQGKENAPRALYELYYMAFFIGKSISYIDRESVCGILMIEQAYRLASCSHFQ